MKLFESLKRLLEPRARPPVETIGEATADRPPPPEPSEEPATPDVVAATGDAADVSEIRELLEAVADTPLAAPQTPVAVPETPTAVPEIQAEAEPPAPEPAFTPVREHAPAGDALVLTLATPPASFTVAKATVTIGRGEENKIRLDDFSVSRRHARIAWKQGGYWISDLGSMGGTWVDGSRLNAPHRIAAGEVIDIGVCRLTVSSAGEPQKADAKRTTGRTRSELADSRRQR